MINMEDNTQRTSNKGDGNQQTLEVVCEKEQNLQTQSEGTDVGFRDCCSGYMYGSREFVLELQVEKEKLKQA